MKKVIYALTFLLVAVSGLVFANYQIKKEAPKQSTAQPTPATEKCSELKKWEASPDGIKFKEWEASPAGQKVWTGINNISKEVREASNMEAVVTDLSLPPGSRLGFGIMVKINGDNYILSFGTENANDFRQLHNLKVNDRIVIKSGFVSYAPKYAYPIVRGNYVEQDSKMIYKRIPPKNGC